MATQVSVGALLGTFSKIPPCPDSLCFSPSSVSANQMIKLCVCVCVHTCVHMCGVWGDVRKLWGRVIEKPFSDKEHLPKLVIIP